MTPKFFTPCYVRVEDPQERKEVCEKLEQMGYKNAWHSLCKDKILVTTTGGIYLDVVSVENSNMVDCGTNTELFLALAGMRSDTDMGQRFVYADDIKFKCLSDNAENYLRKEVLSLGAGEDLLPFRRATAQEIVEHFSQEAV